MGSREPRPSLRDKIRKTILPDIAEVVMSWIEKPAKRIDWNEITAEFHTDRSPDSPNTGGYRSPYPASNRVHLWFFCHKRFKHLEGWMFNEECKCLWDDMVISRTRVELLLHIEALKENLIGDFKPSTVGWLD